MRTWVGPRVINRRTDETAQLVEQSFPAPVADTMAYQVATDVRALRAFVSTGALARGLPPHRVELLTLAVASWPVTPCSTPPAAAGSCSGPSPASCVVRIRLSL